MPNIVKLVFAGLAATIVLSLAVDSAGARRIEISEQGFLVRWTNVIFSFASSRLSCPVTLEGSFHSKTFSKVCGSLIGYITHAFMGPTEPPCAGGMGQALTETLPWRIHYLSFSGTLPTITRIRTAIEEAAILYKIGALGCLIRSTSEKPIGGDINVTTGTIRTWTFLNEFTIPLEGVSSCLFAGNGSLEGTGEIFSLVVPQVRISVRLVQ